VAEANDPQNGIQYNAQAERRAWSAALDLLDEKFGMHGVS